MLDKPEVIVTEDIGCPLNCPRNDEFILAGRDLLHNLSGEFTIVKCKTCGLIRTNPRPTQATIGRYYPENYTPYIGTQIRDFVKKSRPLWKKLLSCMVWNIVDFKEKPLPKIDVGSMLEIGCASGSFLHEMASKGWQVEGIEFSLKAAQAAIAQGYNVYSGPLETAPENDRKFDLIVGWMVLEHLHDPIACLTKLRQWSNPNTWLVLSVPNAASMDFRIFKDKWYALQLPTHLYHFTPRTISQVLSSAGWSVQQVHHQRVLSNLVASIGYFLREKGIVRVGQHLIDFPDNSGRWHFMFYPLSFLLGSLGHTGRMTIWAKVSK